MPKIPDQLTTSFTSELDAQLKDIPGYRGAHGKDWCLNSVPGEEDYVILNLRNSDAEKGSHWVAVANCPWHKKIVYFDSYGVPPPNEVLSYMRKSGKQPVGTNNQIQVGNSKACGWYCVDFIRSMAAGQDLYDILYRYAIDKKNALNNDQLLKDSLSSEMTILAVQHPQTGYSDALQLDGSATDIKNLLSQIADTNGDEEVEVKIGKASPQVLRYDTQEVAGLQDEHEMEGGFIGSLLGLIPTAVEGVKCIVQAVRNRRKNRRGSGLDGDGLDGDGFKSFLGNLVKKVRPNKAQAMQMLKTGLSLLPDEYDPLREALLQVLGRYGMSGEGFVKKKFDKDFLSFYNLANMKAVRENPSYRELYEKEKKRFTSKDNEEGFYRNPQTNPYYFEDGTYDQRFPVESLISILEEIRIPPVERQISRDARKYNKTNDLEFKNRINKEVEEYFKKQNEPPEPREAYMKRIWEQIKAAPDNYSQYRKPNGKWDTLSIMDNVVNPGWRGSPEWQKQQQIEQKRKTDKATRKANPSIYEKFRDDKWEQVRRMSDQELQQRGFSMVKNDNTIGKDVTKIQAWIASEWNKSPEKLEHEQQKEGKKRGKKTVTLSTPQNFQQQGYIQPAQTFSVTPFPGQYQ